MHDDDLLQDAASFAARGGEARLRRDVREGALVRIRHGVYVDGDVWAAAHAEQRMRLRARAHARTVQHPSVYAGPTAGAVLRLPLFRLGDERVHTIDDGGHAASSTRGSVVRHRGALAEEDVEIVDGLHVTTLERTVFDVIRSVGTESGIALADAAMRQVAWRGPGAYDLERAERFRGALWRRAQAAPGARGVRRAVYVIARADGRAQLPGESLSRLWMHELGVPAPELQLEVRLAEGRAFPDFSWPRLRRFGEFDGDGKYIDVVLTGGRTVSDILRTQRDREGAVVAATGWAPLRWGWDRLGSRDAFRDFLRSRKLLPSPSR